MPDETDPTASPTPPEQQPSGGAYTQGEKISKINVADEITRIFALPGLATVDRVELKPGDEPVTIADRRASEMIVAGLARFGDPIISEESPVPAGAMAAPRHS